MSSAPLRAQGDFEQTANAVVEARHGRGITALQSLVKQVVRRIKWAAYRIVERSYRLPFLLFRVVRRYLGRGTARNSSGVSHGGNRTARSTHSSQSSRRVKRFRAAPAVSRTSSNDAAQFHLVPSRLEVGFDRPAVVQDKASSDAALLNCSIRSALPSVGGSEWDGSGK